MLAVMALTEKPKRWNLELIVSRLIQSSYLLFKQVGKPSSTSYNRLLFDSRYSKYLIWVNQIRIINFIRVSANDINISYALTIASIGDTP